MGRAFLSKDTSYDGLFFVAVKTTGIFCRPSCLSRPRAENVEFFPTLREAVLAGYRPCKRCHPQEVNGRPPAWVSGLMDSIEANPEATITAADLRSRGITPEKARRWFAENYGMTFAEWQRGRRLAAAFTQIRRGSSIDNAVFSNGYRSHSGFHDAFTRTFGTTPGQAGRGKFIAAQLIETPLGPMVVAALEDGVCLVEFSSGRMLEHNCEKVRALYGLPVLPVSTPILDKLKYELEEYFGGRLKQFSVPLAIRGTPFQERVWRELLRIPYGQTASYQDIALRTGDMKAVRAVARANAVNRIGILIPCHRVVGKDGGLTGYGGGLWRKRLLIELERTGKLPGAR